MRAVTNEGDSAWKSILQMKLLGGDHRVTQTGKSRETRTARVRTLCEASTLNHSSLFAKNTNVESASAVLLLIATYVLGPSG